MKASTEQVNATVTQLRASKLQTGGGHAFCSSGQVEKRQRLFMVTPGVDLVDALNTASDLLDAARTPIFDAGSPLPLLQPTPAARYANHATLPHDQTVSASLRRF